MALRMRPNLRLISTLIRPNSARQSPIPPRTFTPLTKQGSSFRGKGTSNPISRNKRLPFRAGFPTTALFLGFAATSVIITLALALFSDSTSALSAKSSAYTRLDPKKEKTRILVLEPGKDDDELKGRLEHISSLESYSYSAVSYRWSEDKAGTLFCGELELKISSTVRDVLRKIRRADKPCAVWIDQICINQDDDVEKGYQVNLMREIYAHACHVIVWIGEENETDRFAFKNSDIFNKDRFLNMLRDREWFRRTWVVQEVACSRKASVWCGNEKIPWEKLAEFVINELSNIDSAQRLEEENIHRACESVRATENARRAINGPGYMSLFEAILTTQHNNCGDPRDRVFAVLGLGKDWVDRKKKLEPNYRATVWDVFREFAIWDSENNSTLRTLSCPSGDLSPLPSWVPDWTSVVYPDPFTLYGDQTGFAASKNKKAKPWYTDERRTFVVRGKQVDAVQRLGPRSQFVKATSRSSIDRSWIDKLEESRNWLMDCQKFATGGTEEIHRDRFEEFWRTMTCSLTEGGSQAPDKYSEYFSKYLQFMKTVPERYRRGLLDSTFTPVEFSHHYRKTRDFENHKRIEASIEKWSSKRQICLTEKDRLAFVPQKAEEMDIICVIYGSEVPYVLRRMRNGHYRVIGECYVYGIMDGKAVDDDIEARDFPLQ